MSSQPESRAVRCRYTSAIESGQRPYRARIFAQSASFHGARGATVAPSTCESTTGNGELPSSEEAVGSGLRVHRLSRMVAVPAPGSLSEIGSIFRRQEGPLDVLPETAIYRLLLCSLPNRGWPRSGRDRRSRGRPRIRHPVAQPQYKTTWDGTSFAFTWHTSAGNISPHPSAAALLGGAVKLQPQKAPLAPQAEGPDRRFLRSQRSGDRPCQNQLGGVASVRGDAIAALNRPAKDRRKQPAEPPEKNHRMDRQMLALHATSRRGMDRPERGLQAIAPAWPHSPKRELRTALKGNDTVLFKGGAVFLLPPTPSLKRAIPRSDKNLRGPSPTPQTASAKPTFRTGYGTRATTSTSSNNLLVAG